MKNKKSITVLVLIIVCASIVASSFGIFSNDGEGPFIYESIRGEKINIYGKGIYKHMSADVAIQGIAQDYITLFIGVPLLLVSIFFARKNSLRGIFLLSGVLGYFLVTYLFYLAMGLYNKLFLVYSLLLFTSFFAFIFNLFNYEVHKLQEIYKSDRLMKYAGIFLIINASLVSLLWLSIVLPPLLDGSIYPRQLQHYTTLIVQGFDLGLLLPVAFIIGILAVKNNVYGYLFVPIYMIFLSLLMTALVSKIIFMANAGENVIPVVFIMPTIALISLTFSFLLLKRFENVK